jgi:hypothetical protein
MTFQDRQQILSVLDQVPKRYSSAYTHILRMKHLKQIMDKLSVTPRQPVLWVWEVNRSQCQI